METMNQNMPPIGENLGVAPVKKSYGALIAVVVILFLIIIGGLYFLGQRMAVNPYEKLPEAAAPDPITTSMQQQSSSDDLSSIQADLDNTDIDNLDQGAAAIEAEINN